METGKDEHFQKSYKVLLTLGALEALSDHSGHVVGLPMWLAPRCDGGSWALWSGSVRMAPSGPSG